MGQRLHWCRAMREGKEGFMKDLGGGQVRPEACDDVASCKQVPNAFVGGRFSRWDSGLRSNSRAASRQTGGCRDHYISLAKRNGSLMKSSMESRDGSSISVTGLFNQGTGHLSGSEACGGHAKSAREKTENTTTDVTRPRTQSCSNARDAAGRARMDL